MELFIVLVLVAMVVYVFATIQIYMFLQKRNLTKANFLLINFYIFHYVDVYKRVTKEETGKIGSMYYTWLISVNFALACFLIYVLF